ncbi:hypothetical protein [Isoptericola sediminis]|uniref:Uncharacterized protein n=1 Tax=Isoptericola sediminis TaxID=2733572 RepID=A0A849K795_9MICO|nr:hypothetical protein [Isoptericola sediminis]NNU27899.1 hypothetical protein [Isoptericola sediminis]
MPDTTSRPPATAPAVAVHLGAHPPTARAVQDWCGTHRRTLRRHGLTARTTWSELRRAVPALDWRSDRSRRQVREYLTAEGPALFSSHAPLGPAFRHTGGPLHPTAAAGVDGVAAALEDVPWTLHLSIGRQAETLVDAWVTAVRHGHVVTFEDFLTTTEDASWVPLVEHVVATVGADRVTVHDVATDPDRRDAAASVLTTALGELLGGPTGLGEDATADPVRRVWSGRQTEVALAALPHLRSWDERRMLRTFVDGIDVGGAPAWPLTARQEELLAARDLADRTRIRTLVEVR